MNQIRIDTSLLQLEISAITTRDIELYSRHFGEDVANWVEVYRINDARRPSVITLGLRLKRY